jgi:hypothetical protein
MPLVENALREEADFRRLVGLIRNPDFSGFVSRKIWIRGRKTASHGRRHLPGLADEQVAEEDSFPDLLMSKSRKTPASRTC